MQDILVIICPTSETIQSSIINIRKKSNIKRFFVCFDDTNIEDIKKFITPQDGFLSLGNIEILESEYNDIAIRAGLMYNFGYNYLFCNAKNLPDEEEINNALLLLNTVGSYDSNTLWGATKEWMVFYGFDPILKKESSSSNSIPNKNLKAKIGWALRGIAVDKITLLNAICEIIHAENFSIHNNLYKDKFLSLWQEISKIINSTNNENPNTLAISSKSNIKELSEALKIVGVSGTVLMAIEEKEEKFWKNIFTPTQILSCDDNFKIFILNSDIIISKNEYIFK